MEESHSLTKEEMHMHTKCQTLCRTCLNYSILTVWVAMEIAELIWNKSIAVRRWALKARSPLAMASGILRWHSPLRESHLNVSGRKSGKMVDGVFVKDKK